VVRALTPSERRGAVVVVLLLVLGAARDLIVVRLAPRTPAAPRAAAIETPAPGTDSLSQASPAPPPRVDLNRASAAELDALPGIGPVLARRIVEHRERAGPFRSTDELRAVRGVGPRLLERLRPRVLAGIPADSGRGPVPGNRVQSAREAAPGAADSAQVRPSRVR
jgi:competence protein ComEA